ncbi:hypothetical protein SY27_04910 [Flavobacterium sp. 316]|uniref:DUF5683 domain-containing protein n=1 Tax=Flavobacterium sediminilitoris TaxID=2024526 RepID=A0ABY4HHF7_9FLAO|nr:MULTISPECIES: DUF5683 domain-containing protein [Flavobacterium]KIX22018.1 hypothetical protein SY27_04910 [Flavobacterium sp. 316]UOX32280.1 DUF5683 domain-containing protein [Flavobacterium sediminilitoris]
MKKILTILFFSLFLSFNATAQEEISLVAKDSISTTINPLSPAKAAFYSAVLPGLGQAYNKKYWKIPLVYAGLGAGIYFYTWNNKKYHEFRDEYKKRLDGTSAMGVHPIYGGIDNDGLIRGQKFHQRNRDLSALITAGIYLLNIIDANVDAHLLQFNVNDNLSIRPELYQNEIDYKFKSGIRLTYIF